MFTFSLASNVTLILPFCSGLGGHYGGGLLKTRPIDRLEWQ